VVAAFQTLRGSFGARWAGTDEFSAGRGGFRRTLTLTLTLTLPLTLTRQAALMLGVLGAAVDARTQVRFCRERSTGDLRYRGTRGAVGSGADGYRFTVFKRTLPPGP
jgi:hypothetical protein